MTRKKKAQLIVGVVLLTALLVPAIVLCIPSTYTDVVYDIDPLTGQTTVELVDITYIPIVEALRNSTTTPVDVALYAIYGGLIILGVWLVVHSSRSGLKEA